MNGLAGLLALFPGMFEVAAAEAEAREAIGVGELLGTPYGRYAIAHLAGAALQLAAAGSIAMLRRLPWSHALVLLCLVSLGLEIWGFAFKGSLSPLAVPGLVAAALTGALYAKSLR